MASVCKRKTSKTKIIICEIKFLMNIKVNCTVLWWFMIYCNIIMNVQPLKFNKESLQDEHGPQSFQNQQYPTFIPMFTLFIF